MNKVIRKKIQEDIPKKPKILGFYDENEERWVKIQTGVTVEGLKQIAKFIRALMKEIQRIKKLLSLEKIDIVLKTNVVGYDMDFSVTVNKDIEINKFVSNLMRQVQRTSRNLEIKKPSIKFIRLNLTF